MIGEAHVLTQSLPFQILLQISAVCTVSDDVLYAA